MLYFAFTFWLLVIVFSAWGVHHLWSGMIKPKVLNALLLPGTLVAICGHLLGLLVTGATVSQATLFKDDDSGEPETTTDAKPRIPILGPVVIGMLPLLACGMAIYFAARFMGSPLISHLPTSYVGRTLPLSLAGIWQLLRDLISLTESMVAALRAANYHDWRVDVFLYLVICLCIRIRPFKGTVRGSLGAIVIVGIAGVGISSFWDAADARVQNMWATLNLMVATLLLLLIISLLIRGTFNLIQALRANA
ncbi:MAG: hypothetical protein HY287_08555 [Planctomycetes bacterium]|nr:hypothetical protein [Planctomycetota bacterium]MBI3834363.1 hypothetical protein [Planctomycetota bacterium]